MIANEISSSSSSSSHKTLFCIQCSIDVDVQLSHRHFPCFTISAGRLSHAHMISSCSSPDSGSFHLEFPLRIPSCRMLSEMLSAMKSNRDGIVDTRIREKACIQFGFIVRLVVRSFDKANPAR
jgi:hypothetical protein